MNAANELLIYDNKMPGRWSLFSALLILISLLSAIYFTASWIKGKEVIKLSRFGAKNMVLRQMGVYICVILNIVLFVFAGSDFLAGPAVFNNWTIIIVSFLVVEFGFMFIEVQAQNR